MNFIKDRKYLVVVLATLVIVLNILFIARLQEQEKEENYLIKKENSLYNSFNEAVTKASPAVVNIYSEILLNNRNNIKKTT